MRSYGELVINIYMCKDLKMRNANEETGRFINYIMEKDKYLSEIHTNKNRFKGYSFSTPYPIEVDKVYKSGELYNIMVRSYDLDMIERFRKSSNNLNNEYFQVVGSYIEIRNNTKQIKEITNVTMGVCTVVNEYGKPISWTKNNSDKDIEDCIFNNLMDKYNYLNSTSYIIDKSNVFDKVDVINNIGIVFEYKGAKLIGYKYKIKFKDNGLAQELANFMLVTGVLEKNSSLACGFSKAIF